MIGPISIWIVALAVHTAESYELTCDQRIEVEKDLRTIILSTLATDEDGRSYLPNIGGFVRLAFHMCTGTVCTGCINLRDPNNLHLEAYVNALEDVYRRHPFISHGDLWALASIVALQVSESITNRLYGTSQTYMQRTLVFRYGRADCATAPLTNDFYPFPNLFAGLDHVLKFFKDNYGFGDEETVAIMGAHKLGGLRNPFSTQIINQWVSPADTLDNSYFINLVNGSNGWFQSGHKLCSACTPIYFWTNSKNKRLMFNTDMALYKQQTFASGNAGPSTCSTFRSCRQSKTAPIVTDYSKSNDRWLKAFASAFMKMIEIGYSGDELRVPANCS